MRLTLATAVACLGIVGIASADPAHASIKQYTDIPAQGLGPALTSLAKEFDFQVLYRTEVVGTLKTQGVSGAMTAAEALEHVLSGTGLTYKYLDDKTVTIVPVGPAAPLSSSEDAKQGNQNPGGDQKKSFWDGFRLARVDQGKNVSSSSDSSSGLRSQSAALKLTQATVPTGKEVKQSQESPTRLEEIVVTAQKREERLQDVPVPVTVLEARDLIDNNQLRIQDYYASIPGLNIAPGFFGTQNLSIRGISTVNGTANVNPTTGITVDDVPYGGSWFYGAASQIPDFDPGDLARIEVLRGPQGTLYGASSMGGLVKFVTLDPSTETMSGRIEAGTSTIANGAGLGYNVRGSVNLPAGEAWALRASAFTREDPGYIDNPVRGIDGINEHHVNGGHLSALWRPSDALSLKLSALYQDDRAGGSSDINIPVAGFPSTAGLGDLQQNYVRGAGEDEKKLHAYSAIVNARLGGVQLTSVSGYNVNNFSNVADLTPLLGLPSLAFYRGTVDKFSQEIRLSAAFGKSVDWRFGLFYTHEYTAQTDPYWTSDPATGKTIANLFDESYPGAYTEYAAFGDLTWHVIDRLDVQFGMRQSHNKETFKDTTSGLFVGNVTSTNYQGFTANPFTYLFTPQFKFSRDLMAYARLASGYRPGGPNTGVAVYHDPPSFSSDKTYNYEIGTKGDFLDRALSVDASLYYIAWKGVQLSVYDSADHPYTGNGGQAKSQGLELSVEVRPVEGLTLGGWITSGKAVLTSSLPANSVTQGAAGDRLPNTARFSGNFSVDWQFPLTERMRGNVGGALSYVGERPWLFTASSERLHSAPYAQTSLRAGVEYGPWSARLFANNVTDRRGALAPSGAYPFGFYLIQPRTVGVNFARTFER